MEGRVPSKYQYSPSFAGAVIVAMFFGLSGVFHLYQLVRGRTWYFLVFLIGVLFEVIGFSARAYNASETPNWSTIPFIIQTLLPLLAPALFAASIYMILGRLIRSLEAEKLSLVRTTWMTKIFVLGDVLSFAVQCIGGGVLASADSKDSLERGQNIILAGLSIQIVFFGAFITVISVFHKRIISSPTPKSVESPVPWKQFIWVLYSASLLIMVRSIFRVAEFAAGETSVLQTSEAYLYCLDAALMLLVAMIFNVRHPSQVVQVTYQNCEGTEEEVCLA